MLCSSHISIHNLETEISGQLQSYNTELESPVQCIITRFLLEIYSQSFKVRLSTFFTTANALYVFKFTGKMKCT